MNQAKVDFIGAKDQKILAEMVQWYKRHIKSENFAERFDRLWKKVHQGMKKSRLGPHDIETSIARV